MELNDGDVLNAVITDLVADQTIRAFELGFNQKQIIAAMTMGMSHGIIEFKELRARRASP